MKHKSISAILMFILINIFFNTCFAGEDLKTNIIILTNTSEGKFVGDMNHALGIQNAITRKVTNYKKMQYDVSDIDSLTKYIETTKYKSMVVGIGEHGVKAIKEISRHSLPKNTVIIWSGHQYLSELTDIKDTASIIALPKHIKTDALESVNHKAKLVKTVGLAHNVNIQNDNINLALFDIPKSQKYAAVFLGGDASDENGNMLYFNKEQAIQVAKAIVNLLPSDVTLLVTNGPRTGRYNSDTGIEVDGVHRSDKIDATSKSFINELSKNGVKFHFENFVFGQPSAFKSFLYLVNKTNGMAFVTGDSTSMVSEIADNIEPGNLYIIDVESMNKNHHRHVESVFRSGIASLITPNEIRLPKTPINTNNNISAADKIAEAALSLESQFK